MPRLPRAQWKGYLRLSLVSVGVELFTATATSSRPSLHQIHKPTGKRIHYEKVAAGVGAVEEEDIVKGLEVGEDAYVLFDPDELDAIKLESRHTIDLVQFVDADEIAPPYFDRPYYIAPQGDISREGYLVIRAALERSNKIALGQMVMFGHEYLVSVKPFGPGLMLQTLHYAEEVRDAGLYFADIPQIELDEEMIRLAQELIQRKAAAFDPKRFKDRYAEALRALADEKRKGHEIVEVAGEPERPAAKVIDLMEALRQSIGQSKPPGSEQSSDKKPKKKRAKGS